MSERASPYDSRQAEPGRCPDPWHTEDCHFEELCPTCSESGLINHLKATEPSELARQAAAEIHPSMSYERRIEHTALMRQQGLQAIRLRAAAIIEQAIDKATADLFSNEELEAENIRLDKELTDVKAENERLDRALALRESEAVDATNTVWMICKVLGVPHDASGGKIRDAIGERIPRQQVLDVLVGACGDRTMTNAPIPMALFHVAARLGLTEQFEERIRAE